jgi:uncharacterized protein YegL
MEGPEDNPGTDGPASASCDSRQRSAAGIGLLIAVLLGAALSVIAIIAPPRQKDEAPPAPAVPPPAWAVAAPPTAPPILADRERSGGTGGLAGDAGRSRSGEGTGAGASGDRSGTAGQTVDRAPAGVPDQAPGQTVGGTGEDEKPADVPAFGFSIDTPPEPPPAPPVGLPETKDGEGKAGAGTEFLGVSTTAESVVFVLDFSASMRGDGSEDEEGGQVDKSKLLRRALDDAVKRLSRKARFSIILFGGTVKSGMPYVTGDEDLKIAEITKPGAVACLTDAGGAGSGAVTLIPADDTGKSKAHRWMAAREPHPSGLSWPREAMERALLAKPQAIYLLTDGEFEGAASGELVAAIDRLNGDRSIEINAIAFGSEGDVFTLKRIAEENRGKYLRYVVGPRKP